MTTDYDGYLQVLSARLAALQVIPDMAARVQARAELVRPFDLHALKAEIAHASIRILADEDARADVTAGVCLEMPRDRQLGGIGLVRQRDHLLDRRVPGDHGRREIGERTRPGLPEL